MSLLEHDQAIVVIDRSAFCFSDLIFSVRKIISFLSQGTTLMPGTIILTG